jgi:hypothetical protein
MELELGRVEYGGVQAATQRNRVAGQLLDRVVDERCARIYPRERHHSAGIYIEPYAIEYIHPAGRIAVCVNHAHRGGADKDFVPAAQQLIERPQYTDLIRTLCQSARQHKPDIRHKPSIRNPS